MRILCILFVLFARVFKYRGAHNFFGLVLRGVPGDLAWCALAGGARRAGCHHITTIRVHSGNSKPASQLCAPLLIYVHKGICINCCHVIKTFNLINSRILGNQSSPLQADPSKNMRPYLN